MSSHEYEFLDQTNQRLAEEIQKETNEAVQRAVDKGVGMTEKTQAVFQNAIIDESEDPDDIVAVGDLDSQERGTTARKNGDKPEFHHMDLTSLIECFSMCPENHLIIKKLGNFQRTHDVKYLRQAIDLLGIHLVRWEDVARVWMYGAKKYSAYNWMKGGQWTMALDSALRHWFALYEQERNDPETGLPHLAHMMCNLQMLLLWTETYPEGNDLPPKEYFE